MTLIFNADDLYVKVYESLVPGARSRELTTDWAYARNAVLSDNNKVKTSPQIGLGYDKDEVIGEEFRFTLDTSDTGDDFDFAASSSIKYVIDVQFYDEVAQQTVTYTLSQCTPVSSGLNTGYPNKIAREWKVGSYDRAET